MALPVYQSVGTYLSGAGATSAALAVPSGVATDDILIAQVYKESSAAITKPSGFSECTNSPITSGAGASAHWQHLFWKRATAGDTGTYSFTWTGSTWREGQCIRINGAVASGDPTEINNAAGRNSNATTTPAVSGTTGGADRLLVWGATNFSAGAWTAPASFTIRGDTSSAAVLATLGQAGSGSTGSLTGSSVSSDYETAFLIAILPVASAGAQRGILLPLF
jgi:hypothetical protein